MGNKYQKLFPEGTNPQLVILLERLPEQHLDSYLEAHEHYQSLINVLAESGLLSKTLFTALIKYLHNLINPLRDPEITFSFRFRQFESLDDHISSLCKQAILSHNLAEFLAKFIRKNIKNPDLPALIIKICEILKFTRRLLNSQPMAINFIHLLTIDDLSIHHLDNFMILLQGISLATQKFIQNSGFVNQLQQKELSSYLPHQQDLLWTLAFLQKNRWDDDSTLILNVMAQTPKLTVLKEILSSYKSIVYPLNMPRMNALLHNNGLVLWAYEELTRKLDNGTAKDRITSLLIYFPELTRDILKLVDPNIKEEQIENRINLNLSFNPAFFYLIERAFRYASLQKIDANSFAQIIHTAKYDCQQVYDALWKIDTCPQPTTLDQIPSL